MTQDIRERFPLYRWLFWIQITHSTVGYVAFLLMFCIFGKTQHIDVKSAGAVLRRERWMEGGNLMIYFDRALLGLAWVAWARTS